MLLVYDVTSRESFQQLEGFMADIRGLTSSTVSVMIFGNKTDLIRQESDPTQVVSESQVAEWCIKEERSSSLDFLDIEFLTGSALSGVNIEAAFLKLAGMILSKIEMGVIDPENIESGVQYGTLARWSNISRDGSTSGNNNNNNNNNGISSGGGWGHKSNNNNNNNNRNTKLNKSKKKNRRSISTLVAGSGIALEDRGNRTRLTSGNVNLNERQNNRNRFGNYNNNNSNCC